MKQVYAIAGILCILTSCKKTLRDESVEFAAINFADPFTVHNYTNLLYQGNPIGGTGAWDAGKIIAFSGNGRFTFVDKTTGTPLLDTTLNIEPANPKTYYLVQPELTLPLQIMQNNQASELPVADGYFKVRIANFAKTALPGRKIKIVFNQLDYDTYEYRPVDTMENITSQAPETFTLIKKQPILDNDGNPYTDPDYLFSFLDENNQPILDSSGTPVTASFLAGNAVFTLYIVENISNGADPFVYVLTIFEN